MIDGSEKRNRQLAFELQNLHVCEKRSNLLLGIPLAAPTCLCCVFSKLIMQTRLKFESQMKLNHNLFDFHR